MALYINGQLQTMSSKIRYNESTDMVQIYYQGQWHDWQAGGANIPDGKTVTPINDVTIWQQCAGIANPTYTTLSEVLADTGILQTLMASNNAVDYLVRCKDFIKKSLIPTMTSNTTPSGVASASGEVSGREAYRAFDGDNSTSWRSSNATSGQSGDAWIDYEFASNYAPKYMQLSMNDGTIVTGWSYTIQYSSDGVTYTDYETKTPGAVADISEVMNVPLCKHIRFKFTNRNCKTGSGTYLHLITTLQFYNVEEGVCDNVNAMTYIGQNNYASNTLLGDSDWRTAICNSTYFESVLNVKVPTMTSNTTPSGEVSAKDYNSGNLPYYAFDGKNTSPYYWRASSNPSWIKYDFGKTAKFYLVGVMNQSGSGRSFSATVSGSLDNSTFNTMSDSFSCPDNGVWQYAHLDGSSCRYLRLDTDATGASYPQALVQEMNFYGREDV